MADLEKIAEQTDISSGETSLGLTLVRESGTTFFLPLRLSEGELSTLLQFLLSNSREVQYEPRQPEGELPFENGGYEPDEYDQPPEHYQQPQNMEPPARDEQPPEFQPGYTVEGDDFEGGGGIDQL